MSPIHIKGWTKTRGLELLQGPLKWAKNHTAEQSPPFFSLSVLFPLLFITPGEI